MLQQGDAQRIIPLGHADEVAEIPDRLRGVTSAAQSRYRGQARIVPAVHVSFINQLDQAAFAEHGVGEIQPGELDLLGVVDIQFVQEPVVEGTMVLELQRAHRMGDVLDRIGLPVGEVVHRVDRPFVAGAVVRFF